MAPLPGGADSSLASSDRRGHRREGFQIFLPDSEIPELVLVVLVGATQVYRRIICPLVRKFPGCFNTGALVEFGRVRLSRPHCPPVLLSRGHPPRYGGIDMRPGID